MNYSSQVFKMHAVGCVALSLTLLASVSVAGNSVLGNLNANNRVSIVSSTGTLPVEDTYTYFAGDKIVTAESAGAGLSLNPGGGVYVGENSTVTVDKSGSEYLVTLEKGSVAFSFEENIPFKVQILGTVVQSTDPSQAISGLVSVDAGGGIVLKSFDGDLSVSSDSGATTLVGMGETFTNAGETGEFVNVQVVEAAAGGGLSATIVAAIAAALAALAYNESQDAATTQDINNALAGISGANAGTATVDDINAAIRALRDANLANIRALRDAAVAAGQGAIVASPSS